MAINLERFNRIIDLTFTPKIGGKTIVRRSIICPRHGIKPNIEINGTYGEAQSLQVFNITVKNLYLDLRAEQYSRVKVRAGYANNYITIEAEIFDMFQESPGPEGTTVIQCKLGDITSNWLDSTVQLSYKAGTRLSEILSAIKTKLNASDVTMGLVAKTLWLEAPFYFDGSARVALAKLEEIFSKNNLQVFMRGSKLCAVCLQQGDYIVKHVLQYLSAPPQQNPGDKEGSWHTMITAPWMPEVQPGDLLIIPSQVYIRNLNLVGGAKATQVMQVTQMSFHFGTKGGANQMTCEGFIVR